MSFLFVGRPSRDPVSCATYDAGDLDVATL